LSSEIQEIRKVFYPIKQGVFEQIIFLFFRLTCIPLSAKLKDSEIGLDFAARL